MEHKIENKYKFMLINLLQSLELDPRPTVLETILKAWVMVYDAAPVDLHDRFNKAFLSLGNSVLGSSRSKAKVKAARANGRQSMVAK